MLGTVLLALVVPVNVPFANHVSGVAYAFQNLCKRNGVVTYLSSVAGLFHINLCHPTQTGLMRVQPRKQGSARGTATGIVVKPRVSQAVFGKLVDVGSFYFTAVTTQIGITHIVGKNNNNVRLFLFGVFTGFLCFRKNTEEKQN